MAIYFPMTKIKRSDERALVPGQTVSADGQLLMNSVALGVSGVKVTAGAGGEVLAGFLLARTSAVPISPVTWVKTEQFVVPVGDAVVLARTPVASTVFAWDVTAAAAATIGTLTGNSQVLTGAAGHTVTVTYRYALTAVEARSLQGDQMPAGYSGNILGSVGLAQSGVIYTNAFDTASNFHAGAALTAKAGGLVGVGGGGTALNAYVVDVPTVDRPYLGIEFNFA